METDAAGPVDVVVELDEVDVLAVPVEDVVLAAVISFAPQTPFCTGAPSVDLR